MGALAALLLLLAACDGATGSAGRSDAGRDGSSGPDRLDAGLVPELADTPEASEDTVAGPDLGWLPAIDLSTLDPSRCAPDEPIDFKGFDPNFPAPAGPDPVANKSYPLLVLLADDDVVAGALSALVPDARSALTTAVACDGEQACLRPLLIDAIQALSAAGIYAALGEAGPGFVAERMRPSGCFQRWAGDDDATLFAQAWAETLAGLVAAFDRFAGELDAETRGAVVAAVDEALGPAPLFFEALLEVSLGLTHAAGRDEGGRYEPMDEGENAAALARLSSVDFAAYPFAAMIVPGQGPGDLDTPLHEYGRLRCGLAWERLQAGVAPFIITSGGHVHPDRTPYCESLEMKRYLREALGVPEDRILVDPHARHTPTNLRNTARLLLRYGFPPDKPVLTTTDMFQSAYINALGPRCEDELNYVPWRRNVVLSIYDNCVLVDPTSLHVAPGDPLDP